MTMHEKRKLTDADRARIAELWREYRSIKVLRDHALPPTANGAWLYEAATLHMAYISDELEALCEATFEAETAELDK